MQMQPKQESHGALSMGSTDAFLFDLHVLLVKYNASISVDHTRRGSAGGHPYLRADVGNHGVAFGAWVDARHVALKLSDDNGSND